VAWRRRSLLLHAWSLNESVIGSEHEFLHAVEGHLDELVNATFEAFAKGVHPKHLSGDNIEATLAWTFMSSLFFATTVITTIGEHLQVWQSTCRLRTPGACHSSGQAFLYRLCVAGHSSDADHHRRFGQVRVSGHQEAVPESRARLHLSALDFHKCINSKQCADTDTNKSLKETLNAVGHRVCHCGWDFDQRTKTGKPAFNFSSSTGSLLRTRLMPNLGLSLVNLRSG